MSIVGPPKADVTWQDLDDRIVVFNPETGRAAALNGTASSIWRLATGELDEDEIVASLAQVYEVEATAIRNQVFEVIGRLRAEDLFSDSVRPPDQATDAHREQSK